MKTVHILHAVLVTTMMFALFFLDYAANNGPSATAASRALQMPGTLIYLPMVINRFPPHASSSYYITDLSPLYNIGFQLGTQDYNSGIAEDRLVILDFGYPKRSGSNLGTSLVSDPYHVFYSTTEIALAVEQFAFGYYLGTLSNYAAHLRIVVGTNSCCFGTPLAVYQDHGTAWGQMMNTVSQTVSSLYGTQVDVVAGSDMEPNFTGVLTETVDPYGTAQWVTNFAAANTQCNPDNGKEDGCLYNYGNDVVMADDNTPCATGPSSEWHACDVWFVSWGVTNPSSNAPFARPLPEIYHARSPNWPDYGPDATNWKDLAFDSVNATYNVHHFGPMYFVGSLTTYGTNTTTNSPADGYYLLYNALNSDGVTGQLLRWSTDMCFQPPGANMCPQP